VGSFTGLNTTSTDGEITGSEKTVSLTVADANETGTVIIDRDPEYVEDEAVIGIRDLATDETYYSVTVDLDNETITDITEWRSD
jgi:hypothetical protein